MDDLKEVFLRNITHSEGLDEVFGFDVAKIEKELLTRARELRPRGDMQSWGSVLHGGNQTWVGLSPKTLQTPYEEIKLMCELISPAPGEKVLDLGAGYGRMGVALALFYPGAHFLGLELVRERVEAGNKALEKLGSPLVRLMVQDLTSEDFKLPEADYYFIYDYGKIPHIRHTLGQLAEMADRKCFKVVARGKGVRSLIEKEHPWLSGVHRPHHEANFSVYYMAL